MKIIVVLFAVGLSFAAHVVAQASDYSRQFPAEQIETLLVGDSSVEAIRVNSRRALSIGVATLFLSPQSGSLSLHSSLTLANELSQKGWETLIVTPTWFQPLNNATRKAETASITANNMTTPSLAWQSDLANPFDYEHLSEQLKLLISSIDNANQNIAGFRMTIAEGMNAALILNTGKSDTLPLPDAAALIAPFWPDQAINNTLAELSASYPAPLLDIGFASSNRFSVVSAADRLRKVNVNVKLNYRQRNLPRAQRRSSISWIGGEIVGWTRYLGW